ncbi:MAG: chaperonin GroEL [Anaerolineae bacterium]|nr:chaperonin GroEL [Anaerolineae bacterium]
MTKPPTQRIIFQPAAAYRMLRGVDQLANAVRVTLGPRPRYVAIERPNNGSQPELLDNGGIIARRVVELPDRDEDMGAMLLRNLMWRLNDQVGDGTATAAVLFQSVFREGIRYIAAGGNAMLLRNHLERGLAIMLDTLDQMTIRVQGKEQLAQVAESICHDAPLAEKLGEIFDVIGEYGRLEIKQGNSRALEIEYNEGMYWDSGAHSPYMLPEQAGQATNLEEVAILLTDLTVDDPMQLVPILEMALQVGVRGLVIVARQLSARGIALLLVNQQKLTDFRVIAVRTPGLSDDEKAVALNDMAMAVGGQPILQAAGQTLQGVTIDDLGYARQAWANTTHFGVVGGGGDPRQLRSHLMTLRTLLRRTHDPAQRKSLQQRLGRLMGGSATLWVGGATNLEVTTRQELAQRTADSLRGAVLEGILPGGGAALLACCPALQEQYEQSVDPDERAACRILMEAAELPIRTILANAGVNADKVLARLDHGGVGCGYDVRTGQIVDMAQAGVLDVTAVQKAALRSAVAGAALALTVDVLVHRKRPEMAMG